MKNENILLMGFIITFTSIFWLASGNYNTEFSIHIIIGIIVSYIGAKRTINN